MTVPLLATSRLLLRITSMYNRLHCVQLRSRLQLDGWQPVNTVLLIAAAAYQVEAGLVVLLHVLHAQQPAGTVIIQLLPVYEHTAQLRHQHV
jgi:hypothetical protein